MTILNIPDKHASELFKYYIFKRGDKHPIALNRLSKDVIKSDKYHKYKNYLKILDNAVSIDYLTEYRTFIYEENEHFK